MTRGPCTLCALLARVCRTMQLAPFRCAGGRCRLFIDRALASDCSNLTTHAIPDIRETNNHWTSCQPLSLHGLGQGSGSLSVRDKERNIARWSQGPAYLSRSDLQEVPSSQSILEALWFNTSYFLPYAQSHLTWSTTDPEADTCSDGHPQHARLTRALPTCLPCGTSGPVHSHVSQHASTGTRASGICIGI